MPSRPQSSTPSLLIIEKIMQIPIIISSSIYLPLLYANKTLGDRKVAISLQEEVIT
jgi:hypothetical protein